MRKIWIMWIIGMCIFAVFEKSEFVCQSLIYSNRYVVISRMEREQVELRHLSRCKE